MWSRKEAGSVADVQFWPSVNVAALSAQDAAIYQNRKKAIELYFEFESLEKIYELTGIGRSELVRYARRCILLAPDGRVFGFRALIPYFPIKPYSRSAQLGSKRQHQQGGYSGALDLLLKKFPKIEDALITSIGHLEKASRPAEHKIRQKDLHRVFLKCALAQGVT